MAVERRELLLAVEHRLDRRAGLAGERRDQRLEPHERLRPERAAHGGRDDADVALVDPEHAREVGAHVERRLRRRPDRQPPALPLGDARRAAPARMCAAPARAEHLLDHDVGRVHAPRPRRRGGAGSGGRRSSPSIGRTSIETASPRRRARRASCSSGAPSATASTGSKTAGSSSHSTSTAAAAAPRAAARVGAATAATMSPANRATSVSTRWSLSWQPYRPSPPTSARVSATQPSGQRRTRRSPARARARAASGRTRRAASPGRSTSTRVALGAGHARVEADRAHAASSSSARRTSTSVTRRRYAADPRASDDRLAPARRSGGRSPRAAPPPAAGRRRARTRRGSAAEPRPPPRPRRDASAAAGRGDGDARPVLGRARAELAVRRPLGRRRHHDLDQQLVGLDARLVVAEDQLADGRRVRSPRGERSTTRAPSAASTAGGSEA